MFTILTRLGQFTVQALSSIGVYEIWQKYMDSPSDPDESSVEVERRFHWTIKGAMLILVAFLTYKLTKKKK